METIRHFYGCRRFYVNSVRAITVSQPDIRRVDKSHIFFHFSWNEMHKNCVTQWIDRSVIADNIILTRRSICRVASYGNAEKKFQVYGLRRYAMLCQYQYLTKGHQLYSFVSYHLIAYIRSHRIELLCQQIRNKNGETTRNEQTAHEKIRITLLYIDDFQLSSLRHSLPIWNDISFVQSTSVLKRMGADTWKLREFFSCFTFLSTHSEQQLLLLLHFDYLIISIHLSLFSPICFMSHRQSLLHTQTHTHT